MNSPPPAYSPVSPPPIAIAHPSHPRMPAVPAPAVSRSINIPLSPFARGHHHRSISESAHLLKHTHASSGRYNAHTALHQSFVPGTESPSMNQHPESQGFGDQQYHSHLHHQHFLHDHGSPESDHRLPSAPVAPHSPPYDHSGPSSSYRHVHAQHRQVIPTSRHRTPSGSHDRRFRCGPDCFAAEAPYHLLATVIGRASVNNYHRGLGGRHAPLKADGPGESKGPKRPDLQTRRSRRRSGLHSSPELPRGIPHEDASLKPLAFDSRSLQTPPIDPIQSYSEGRLRHPSTADDFFGLFGSSNHASSSASPCQPLEIHCDPEIPRSNSAPSVPLVADHERRLSTVSSASIVSSEAGLSRIHPSTPSLSESLQPFALEREDTDVTIRPHQTVRERSAIPTAAPGASLNRFATVSGRRPISTHSQGASLDSIIGDPSELSSFLGPELAATLKQRMHDEHNPVSKSAKRKEESLTEIDCSFDQPLATVLNETMQNVIGLIPLMDDYHIAEYCCGREGPNIILTEAIKSLCIRSVGITHTKKTFAVTHQCVPDFDLRLLQAQLAISPRSYRKIKTIPTPVILSSFSFAGFDEPAVIPKTVDFAVCGTELSRLHGILAPKPMYAFTSQAEEREQLADRELTAWLKARAKEVKPGGILICSFAIRTSPTLESELPHHEQHGMERIIEQPRASPYQMSMSLPTSPRTSNDGATTPLTEINPSPFVPGPPLPSPPMTDGRTRRFRADLWQSMSHALSPAIQRLVTLGEIRTHVAPALVDVPYWPRTLAGARRTIGKATTEWEIIRESDEDHTKQLIGLGINDGPQMDIDMDIHDGAESKHTQAYDDDYPYSSEERREWAEAGVRIHRLTHPAWTAYQKGKMDRAAYARRIATYCRFVYEGHLKKTLREKGKMDIGQSASVVQELFKILVEKCELGALDALEIDVGVVVLRRK